MVVLRAFMIMKKNRDLDSDHPIHPQYLTCSLSNVYTFQKLQINSTTTDICQQKHCLLFHIGEIFSHIYWKNYNKSLTKAIRFIRIISVALSSQDKVDNGTTLSVRKKLVLH